MKKVLNFLATELSATVAVRTALPPEPRGWRSGVVGDNWGEGPPSAALVVGDRAELVH